MQAASLIKKSFRLVFFGFLLVEAGSLLVSPLFFPSGAAAVVLPTNHRVTATTTVSATTVWEDVGDGTETLFYLSRQTACTGASTQVASIAFSLLTYSFTGLTPNTQYCFAVRAADGDGVMTATVTTTADYTKAVNPTSVTATAGGATSANLSWGAGVTAVNPNGTVYGYWTLGVATSTVTQIATTITATISGLSASTGYTVYVSSQNNDGTYNAAQTASVTTSAAPASTVSSGGWNPPSPRFMVFDPTAPLPQAIKFLLQPLFTFRHKPDLAPSKNQVTPALKGGMVFSVPVVRSKNKPGQIIINFSKAKR